MKQGLRSALHVAVWIFGVIILLMTAVQIILSEKVCTRIVREVSPQIFEAKLDLSAASISLFRHFPSVSVTIDSMILSNPGDTIATFRRFHGAVNVFSLMRGTLSLKNVKLERPRLNVRVMPDGTVNLSRLLKPELFSSDTVEVEDSAAPFLKNFRLRSLSIVDKTRIHYSDEKHTVFAGAWMNTFDYRGDFSTADPAGSNFNLNLDTLYVFGRTKRDTLLFCLDHIHLLDEALDFDVDADAKIFVGTKKFGRVGVPVHLDSRFSLAETDDSQTRAEVSKLGADVAMIHLDASGNAVFGDSLYIDARAAIQDLDLHEVLGKYVSKIWKDAAAIDTDAHLSAEIAAIGWCAPAAPGRRGLDVSSASVSIKSREVNLSAKASASDLLGKDPSFSVTADAGADMSGVGSLLSGLLPYNLAGKLTADISGSCSLSQLNMYDIWKAKLKAGVKLSDMEFVSQEDSLRLFCSCLEARLKKLEPEEMRKLMKGFANGRRMDISAGKDRKISASVVIDSVNISSGSAMTAACKDVKLFAQTSETKIVVNDTMSVNPTKIFFYGGKIRIDDFKDSISVSIRKTHDSYIIRPSYRDPSLPVVSAKIQGDRVRLKSGPHRLILSSLDLNGIAKKKADSGKALSDIFEDLFENWDFNAKLALKKARIATPAFPLKTNVKGIYGSVNNKGMALDTLRIYSGGTDLKARGKLSGLRDAAAGKGKARLDLTVVSDSLNLSQLLVAYSSGVSNMKKDMSAIASADDDDKMDRMLQDTTLVSQSDTAMVLVTIPENVEAKVALRGRNARYSELFVEKYRMDLIVKDRCALVRGLNASSSVGKMNADLFYSTPSDKEASAGFNLNLLNVEASKVLRLMPSVDTLMPLLKSFDGRLNLNLAATTKIDEGMNIMPQTMEGVMRFTGSDLTIKSDKKMERICRLLRMKKPDTPTVDTMTVECILHNGTAEIFPFLLKIDRWSLAIAGTQNIDQSFNYHFSVTKSPMMLKLGANVSGSDFSDVNFKLGKAKYTEKNLPSFSKTIDTTRVNLVNSIKHVFDKGVRKAIRENEQNNAVSFDRARRSHRQSAEKMTELTPEELKKLDGGASSPAEQTDEINKDKK